MRLSVFHLSSGFILFLLLIPSTGFSWPAKVVSVSDGDTITVLHNGRQERIRLYGIDTPEKKQEYGQQAKQITSALIAGRDVEVIPKRLINTAESLAWLRSTVKASMS